MIYNYFNQTEGKHLPIPHHAMKSRTPYGCKAVVHKAIDDDDRFNGAWTVTDLATGCSLARDYGRKSAVEKVIRTMERITEDRYNEAIGENIAKNGVSNPGAFPNL